MFSIVTFLAIPQIDSLVFDASSFISAHPALVNEIASHSLAHVIYSFIKRTSHRRGLNRREMRKIINRRNRWFVDNIIMHHKRLHDYNRQIVVRDARKRSIIKKESSFSETYQNNKNNDELNSKLKNRSHFYDSQNYQGSSEEENRNKKIQDIAQRLNARKKRAQSRWIATFHNNSGDNASN